MNELPSIWSGGDELAAKRRAWFVLHVKPRTEKKVVLFLRKYACFCHLPVYLKVTKVQRRKVRHELPLFPGYVFARLSAAERLEMLKTNLLVRAIYVSRPREMIHQLRQIARAMKGMPELIRPAQMFKAGDYVRVKYGPLRGTEGYVKRRGANMALCLNVEILGSAVEVAISPSDIEKVE